VGIGTFVAIYFIVWWVVLFAVLPWGVKTQADANDVAPGTEPGAPARPLLLKKAIATTIVAAIVTGALAYVIKSGVVRLEDFPVPFKTNYN